MRDMPCKYFLQDCVLYFFILFNSIIWKAKDFNFEYMLLSIYFSEFSFWCHIENIFV